MKKLIALLFVASLGLAVVGCSGGSSADDSSATAPSKVKDKTPKETGDE